ncbi:uncharacterized protein METZ01_LOCUS202899 [marine metagenome]|uniref:Uncharacterized protein n=1 Tax=marine metagenome TaxID=408172 RepID=A0A382EHT6_9ZZZZ|tara:strand:+ start:982 stop:1230 length:249 start_codon:yes stop_codon:yes gene_type:complete
MTKEQPQDTAISQEASPTAEQSNLELTVNDLNLLRQTIDVATQRGAFKANELLTVGTVYNKLETFLSAVSEQQKTQGETNEP